VQWAKEFQILDGAVTANLFAGAHDLLDGIGHVFQVVGVWLRGKMAL